MWGDVGWGDGCQSGEAHSREQYSQSLCLSTQPGTHPPTPTNKSEYTHAHTKNEPKKRALRNHEVGGLLILKEKVRLE